MGLIIRIRGLERKKLRQQSKELYVDQGWSAGMIGKKFGKSPSTITLLLREAGVPIRTKAEAQAMQGERNRAARAAKAAKADKK
jgi:transposase